MLPGHSDKIVTVHRDVCIVDLGVDDVLNPARLAAQMLVVETAVQREVVVDAVYEAVLGKRPDTLRTFDVKGHRRVGTLIDVEVVGLDNLEAALARLAETWDQKSRTPVRISRKHSVRQVQDRVTENVEARTAGGRFVAHVNVHLGGGNTPGGCSGITPAGRE